MANSFKSPAFQWYPKDIIASLRVAEMSAEVECWYRRALDFAWLGDGLPNDPDRIASIVGKGCTREGAEQVLQMFEVDKKDEQRVRNSRQEIERKKQQHNSKVRKEAGRKSGVTRRKQRELDTEQKDEQKTNKNEPFYSYSCSVSPIPKDDFKRLILRVREEFPGTDERLIEIGMLYTMLQRNGSTKPIQSVKKYFAPEVKKVIEANLADTTLDALIEQRRKQYWTEEKP